MQFTKMHGAGNDYVYVDCFHEAVPHDISALAEAVSHRQTGIGADGLILILPSDVADARMRIFNADGSEADMCGNGLRCIGRYLFEHRATGHDDFQIETGKGLVGIHIETRDGNFHQARIDMGPPILTAREIPTTLEGTPPINVNLSVSDRNFRVTCVSMGNPHAVIFIDELTDDLVHRVGPVIERHPAFPERTNVEFVRVVSRNEVEMRVWERGSGETLACGSGACAVAVAGTLTGRTDRRLNVHLTGGELQIEWADDEHVFLTGPAVEVFRGEWPTST